ncbi:MAG: hypothetical protein ACM3PT_09925 [Deltaproteobacteria bacterium]
MGQGKTSQIHQDLPLNESDDHDDISKTPFPFAFVVTNKSVFRFLTLHSTCNGWSKSVTSIFNIVHFEFMKNIIAVANATIK